MSDQQLRCVFPFSELSFDMEIGFILLVEGKRSPFFTVGSLTLFIPNDLTRSCIADRYFVTGPTSERGYEPVVQERVGDQHAGPRPD